MRAPLKAVLRDVADVIASLPTPADRAAAAVKLLGENAEKLVPALAGGSKAIDTFDKAALKMSDATRQRLIEAKDSIERVKNEVILAIGETIGALQKLRNASEQTGAAWQLTRMKNELKVLSDEITYLEGLTEAERAAMGPDQQATIEETIRRNKAAIIELRAQIQRNEEYLGVLPPQAHGGRGGPGLPKPGAGDGDGAGAGAGDTDDDVAAVKKLDSALAALNRTLGEQYDMLGMTASELYEYEAILRATEAAQRDYDNGLRESPALTGEELEAIHLSADAYNQKREILEELEAAAKAAADAQRELERETNKGKKDLEEVEEAAYSAEDAAYDLGEGFANAFARANREGATTKDMLFDLLDVALNVLEQVIAAAIGGASGGAAGGPAGLLGQAFALGIGALSGGGGPAPRAYGGTVETGEDYLVGEHGPELFMPRVPGSIVSNDMSRNIGGSSVVNMGDVHIHTNGGGTPQQNKDLAEKAAAAFERSQKAQIENVLMYHQRDRGIFRPNIVS